MLTIIRLVIIASLAVYCSKWACGDVLRENVKSTETNESSSSPADYRRVKNLQVSISRTKRRVSAFKSRLERDAVRNLNNDTTTASEHALPFNETLLPGSEHPLNPDKCDLEQTVSEHCETFVMHRDVLIVFGSLLEDCIDANQVFYGHRPRHRDRLDAVMRRVIRYDDWGLQTIIAQFELLTSCQIDGAELNWTMPNCSSAQNSIEFDMRLSTILRSLADSFTILQLTMKPLFNLCTVSDTTSSPAIIVSGSHPCSSPVVVTLLLAIAVAEGALLLVIVVYVRVSRSRLMMDEDAADERCGREPQQRCGEVSVELSGAGRVARLLSVEPRYTLL